LRKIIFSNRVENTQSSRLFCYCIYPGKIYSIEKEDPINNWPPDLICSSHYGKNILLFTIIIFIFMPGKGCEIVMELQRFPYVKNSPQDEQRPSVSLTCLHHDGKYIIVQFRLSYCLHKNLYFSRRKICKILMELQWLRYLKNPPPDKQCASVSLTCLHHYGKYSTLPFRLSKKPLFLVPRKRLWLNCKDYNQ
jgi:hypothetical protein